MVKHYYRTVGVECDEVVLFGGQERTAAAVARLLGSGHRWCWTSTRRYESGKGHASMAIPAHRPWTALLAGTEQMLIDDLIEEDANEDQRYSLLVGADRDLLPSLSDVTRAKEAIASFLKGNPPIVAAISTLGDTGTSFVFGPRAGTSALEALRRLLGISGSQPITRVPYRRLRTASLESQFGLE